ncbi:MAG: hypothetical protein GF311_09990 [Candidatus Lokiarchaeota archaeon]|nr:hypothetical protein [Candidatus Lokiarchaeota archaeon]
MNLRKSNNTKSQPINLVLVGVSFLIFSGLGLIFITQMEMQPGWSWAEYQALRPFDFEMMEIDDINSDGNNDILVYADVRYEDDALYNNPRSGGLFSLSGLTGGKIWEKVTDNPVKLVEPIFDLDADGIIDYFVSIASVQESWNEGQQPEYNIEEFSNLVISGKNGSYITSDGFFTDNPILDSVSSSNTPSDDIGYIYCLEAFNGTEISINLTVYSLDNGSRVTGLPTGEFEDDYLEADAGNRALISFNRDSKEELLYIGETFFSLLNRSNPSFSNPIYNYTYAGEDHIIKTHEIIEDLNADGVDEILIITEYDNSLSPNKKFNLTWFSGSDGSLMSSFNQSLNTDTWTEISIEEISNPSGDNESLILINMLYRPSNENNINTFIYKIQENKNELIFSKFNSEEHDITPIFSLNDDIDGDGISEIISVETFQPIFSPSEVNRFKVFSFIDNSVYSIINTDSDGYELIPIQDIDGDNRKDMVFSGWISVLALSSRDPQMLWISPAFPIGIPLLIVLIILGILGVFLVIFFGKRMTFKKDKIREGFKKRKLATIVNIVVLILMTLSFLLFLLTINIANKTLIAGEGITEVIIVYLSVTIIWYGMLPLTAAIFNAFAPQFAFLFVKLRNFFFKLSKKRYHNEILVSDMGKRKSISSIIKLKRVVLPLLLSIAIGFYTYNTVAPILGYSQSFETFNGDDFIDFIAGYSLLCMLPMILTFVIFSFFIAGNYLLDDAGIVYFRQLKEDRSPGDIEPISIWAQSIIKGVAGISALLTFFTFLSSVNFTGFFIGGETVIFLVFGIFLVTTLFWGAPFLVSFSYILFAEEIMELSVEENTQRLYEIMEKNGYDTTPKQLINLYPNGLPETRD